MQCGNLQMPFEWIYACLKLSQLLSYSPVFREFGGFALSCVFWFIFSINLCLITQ